MKMGLGTWKFTTLVLLSVVMFVNQVEGKWMGVLEFPEQPEEMIMKIFTNCSIFWQAKVGEPCRPIDELMKETKGIGDLPPDKAYLLAKKTLEKTCATQVDANCTGGICVCPPNATCSHAQDRNHTCRKEFNTIHTFLKSSNNGNNTFGHSALQFWYLLWIGVLFIVVVCDLY